MDNEYPQSSESSWEFFEIIQKLQGTSVIVVFAPVQCISQNSVFLFRYSENIHDTLKYLSPSA